MSEVSIIGLDIAKNVFQAHGVDVGGRKLFSRRIARSKVLEFFVGVPRCLVALEACGGAYHWPGNWCGWATRFGSCHQPM